MIETLTFSETVENYTSTDDANILLAKSIGKYVADKLATEYIEYSDGVVIRRLDLPDICVIHRYSSGTRIGFYILKQKNEELSEDTLNTTVLTDFTYNNNYAYYSLDSSTITTGNNLKIVTSSINLTIISNNESFIITDGSAPAFYLLQDENDNFFASVHFSSNSFFLYDKEYTLKQVWSIFNNTIKKIARENINEVLLTDAYFFDFGSTMTNTISQKIKYLYSYVTNGYVVAKSRYKINGEEYYALTDYLLFRTEGGD